MKTRIQNIQEISPIILLSVLLFVSCTQLPIVEENTETAVLENIDTVPAEEGAETINSEVVIEQVSPIQTEAPDSELAVLENNLEENLNETPLEITGVIEVEEEGVEETMPTAEELARREEEMRIHQRNVEALCEEIGGKLGSVSVEDCLIQELKFAGAYSVNARPLALRDFQPQTSEEKTRVLVMGGIHGDEYSSISIMFKWMSILEQDAGNDYLWRFLPSVNPDGLLDGQAVRQNASGVDLNRNFPSQDWETTALEYWRNNTGENPRRYPGEEAASEPEVRWIIEQIEKFEPDVIVSVHAPYHLLDFDGPSQAPDKIGDLYLHQLGVYPGSLGNYAGLDLGIPVVTLELPSAGIMPSVEQIETMWGDMLAWLNSRVQSEQQAAAL